MILYTNKMNANKLSKIFGVDCSEIPDSSYVNIMKITEASLDDDESSNNSDEQASYYNNLECDSYYDLRILYDSWAEYENISECFKKKIAKLLKKTYSIRKTFLSNEKNEIISKSPIEYEFRNALRKLVKYKNEPWVIEISRIITNALRGVDTTMSLIALSLNEDKRKELYIKLSYGIIINIVLETCENMGECEINRLCYFKCTKCNEEIVHLFNEKEHLDICATCLNTNK